MTSNAPMFLSSIRVMASNTDASGSIEQTSLPFSRNNSLIFFISALVCQILKACLPVTMPAFCDEINIDSEYADYVQPSLERIGHPCTTQARPSSAPRYDRRDLVLIATVVVVGACAI